MVRLQDESAGRQAPRDDASSATLMDMGPSELERHLVLNWAMFHTYAKVLSSIRDCVEQLRHKMVIGEMAWPVDHRDECEKGGPSC